MKSKPLVSVIIPFYNTGEQLCALLSQLLSGEYGNLEIICVDDCSTDNSLKKIRKISDHRIRLLRTKENSGPAAARNLGLAEASGELIMFLDSDDSIDPKIVPLLSKNMTDDVALVVCGFLENYLALNRKVKKFCSPAVIRQAGEALKNYTLRSMIHDGRLYSAVNKLYRTQIIRDNNIRFDEKLRFAEDTKFVLDYLAVCPIDSQIRHVLKPLYIYNYGTTTSTVSKSSLSWQNWQRSLNDVRAFIGDSSLKQMFLFSKLRLRFKVSHALAVVRNVRGWRAQRKYVSAIWLILARTVALLHR